MRLVLALLAFSAAAYASPGLLDQPQTFPWSVGLAPSPLAEAGGLDQGQIRVKSSLLWFNTYRQYGLGDEMVQQVDMEGLLGVVSADWSPLPQWELGAEVQGWALDGGIMDYFLSGFHGALFLPNQGRDEVPDGGYRDYWEGHLDDDQPTAGLTQTSLSLRWFDDSWSASAWVKPPLPAPDDWAWTDRWAGGAAVGWGDETRWMETDWTFGGMLGLVIVENDTVFPETTGPSYQFGAYLTALPPWGPRLVAEASWTKVPRDGEGYLGEDAGLLTTGGQFVLGDDWMLEVALTEEFLTWACLEVGFQVAATYRLGDDQLD